MSYGAQLSVLTLMPMIFVFYGLQPVRKLALPGMIIQAAACQCNRGICILKLLFSRKSAGEAVYCLCGCIGVVYLGVNIYLVLFWSTVSVFVLLLNTSIWFMHQNYTLLVYVVWVWPLFLHQVPAAGSFIPIIAGLLFDTYGMMGVFGLAAAMYSIFAVCIQMGPETYGRSLEDLTLPADGNVIDPTIATTMTKQA